MDDKETRDGLEPEAVNENREETPDDAQTPDTGNTEAPQQIPQSDTVKETIPSEEESEDEAIRNLRITRMSAHSKKKKSIVNGMDLLILVVVIAVAVCLATRFNPFGFLKGSGSEQHVLEYEILITGVDDVFSLNIQDGDRVFGADPTNDMGSVTGAVIVDDYTQLVYVDGRAELVPYGNLVNLTVKIRVENVAYVSGVGYTVGGTRVAVGCALDLLFPSFSASGTVVNVDRVA